jgi:hypothetical protein
MQHDRVIEQALRDVRGILQGRSNDTALCFVLRAVKHILSDKAQSPRAVLNRLWDALDEPELSRALGVKQNSRISVWRKKPPAR